MQPNKLTPGYNLMWESSRMMLPEHKQVLRAHEKELNKQTKPLLDEQQITLFSEQINEAFHFRQAIKVKVFDPFETVYRIGEVKQIDGQKQRIKLDTNDGIEWILFQDILNVSIM
ncbi:hypothetical protein GCM10011351_23950 [Paraliobacillus quinghaiensis]|uniref:YolD-like family protein n=1 Tax=Paraliobacillus quinghaiensis TaxID=470815 RepID=A0A917WWZ4_9BACI|nr:YolD-like family protein [Paraliobacillus quinghaiensis]GGM36970.1 hypothetical protein GCM10011351_23950 [Paraliobacillus quinghaiensis]